MARFVLDTNIVSELAKDEPNPAVVGWLDKQDADQLFLSVVSIGEMIRGIERLTAGRRRDALVRWIERDVERQFAGRVLVFDQKIAELWGRLMGAHDRSGTPRPIIDMQIAATTFHHGMTLATRNTRDFAGTGVALVNPWTD